MSRPVRHLPALASEVAPKPDRRCVAPPRARLLSRQSLSWAVLACCATLNTAPAAASTLSEWGAATRTAPAAVTTTAEVAFDVTGIGSFTRFLGAGNVVTFLQIAPFAHVTAIAFDVNLTAFEPSVLSSLAVVFTDSGITDGVSSRPGFGTDTPGTQSFVGGGDLIAQNLDFFVGSDGRLRLEFVEAFDDPGVAPDGLWNFGSLRFTVSAVPEPASVGLMALGLCGLAGLAHSRRRRLQG